jgi:hypothetical protein
VFKEMVNRDAGSTDCTAKTKTPAPPPKKAGQQQLVEKSALYSKILHILWTRIFPNIVGAATNTLELRILVSLFTLIHSPRFQAISRGAIRERTALQKLFVTCV